MFIILFLTLITISNALVCEYRTSQCGKNYCLRQGTWTHCQPFPKIYVFCKNESFLIHLSNCTVCQCESFPILNNTSTTIASPTILYKIHYIIIIFLLVCLIFSVTLTVINRYPLNKN